MINEEKLEKTMLELGHDEYLKGTPLLRKAARVWRHGLPMMELYGGLAAATGDTPSRVERAMRHSIERAWNTGSLEAQYRVFGYSVPAEKGCPSNSQWIARMARFCREEIE